MDARPMAMNPPLSRWLLSVGVDALLLALLWWEHLYPRSEAFELGALLVLVVTVNAWVRLLRQLWLARKVRKVFGNAIDHLRPAPLCPAYRLVSGLGDVLIVGSLCAMGKFVLAGAYGLAALIVILSQRWLARPPAAHP